MDAHAPAERSVVRREYEPISAAAAVLFPESQVSEWEDEPLLEFKPVLGVEYQADSSYDDVWSQNVDICGYCAQVVDWDHERCPQCQRSLSEKHFRYPRPTADLYVLFVLRLGSVVVFSLQLLYDLVGQTSILMLSVHGLVAVSIFVLAVAVYVRKPWAYWVTLVVLPLALLSAVFGQVDANTILGYVPISSVNPGLTLIAVSLFEMLVAFIQPLQVLAAALSFFYAIFRCGSDFIRVKTRLVAEVEPSLRAAADYYAAGQRYAKRGLWATAILHWQRAAANEPNRAFYHRILGEAFARLGFYRRSLDLYQSAHRLTTDTKTKMGLVQRITELQTLLKTQ